jgi:BlaI family transcriptional regulator, penicillinase repressor
MLKKQQKGYANLSRRERQVMDILYREERATAARVRELLPDPPTYSAVRALMRVLEEKGCVRHEEVGLQYVYAPSVPRDEAKQSAMGHLVRTFFGGSAEEAVAALVSGHEFSRDELERLSRLIAKAKKEDKR